MLMWFIIYSFILKSHPLCVTFYSCYSLKCALSFSGGSISTSEVVRRRYVGFSSVCLHASPIDLNTAVTTIWRQREACWRNDNSLSFLLFCAPPPVWSAYICLTSATFPQMFPPILVTWLPRSPAPRSHLHRLLTHLLLIIPSLQCLCVPAICFPATCLRPACSPCPSGPVCLFGLLSHARLAAS